MQFIQEKNGKATRKLKAFGISTFQVIFTVAKKITVKGKGKLQINLGSGCSTQFVLMMGKQGSAVCICLHPLRTM